MTKRDITKTAFQFNEPERIPFCTYIGESQSKRLTEYVGEESWRELDDNYIHKIYAVDHYLRSNGLEYIEGDHIIKDSFGCVWDLGSIHHLIGPPLKEAEVGDYKLPDLSSFYKNHANAYIEREIEKTPTTFRTINHTFGLFERAWSLRGFEEFLMDMYLNPKFCEEILEMIADWIITGVNNMLKHPVDAIMFTDDYADQRGVIFGIDKFRELFKPHWKRIFEPIKKAGVYTIMHVCGNSSPAIPDLIECGLDCIESLQPEAMDVYKLKKEYGKDIRLWGGIGIQQLMTFGTPEDVKNEVKRLKQELGEGGGFILAPTKVFSESVPPKNMIAYLEEANK